MDRSTGVRSAQLSDDPLYTTPTEMLQKMLEIPNVSKAVKAKIVKILKQRKERNKKRRGG